MLFFSLLLVFGGIVRATFALTMPTVTYQISDAETLFEKFIIEHNKWYENDKEKLMRFEIFKKNLQLINEKNMGLETPAFANVESQYAMKYKKVIDLSEQQLVDCDLSCHKCHGGFITNAMNYLKKNGAELEKDYKYVDREQNCQYNKNLTKVTVTGCKDFTGASENQLKEILYNNGPLSIAVSAESWQIYTGTILKDCPSNRTYPIDHAALLVGYGSENGEPFWSIKNSWGTHWGENGYVRIIRGQNACGLTNEMIVTSIIP